LRRFREGDGTSLNAPKRKTAPLPAPFWCTKDRTHFARH
jgi:hypothetical protein